MRRQILKILRGKQMEKVKTFMIFILTLTLITTYFITFSLWADNRSLKNKINDIESELRVYKIIHETGRNGG